MCPESSDGESHQRLACQHHRVSHSCLIGEKSTAAIGRPERTQSNPVLIAKLFGKTE